MIWNALTFQAGFNTTVVVLAAMLIGLAAGLIGSLALLRKRALMADALSHASLPGVAGAFILMNLLGFSGKNLSVLLVGAAITGVLAILSVQGLVRKTRLREDAAIGIVLSVSFGVGIVLLSIIQSMPQGTQGGLGTFIYGQTAAMRTRDAIFMGCIAFVAIVATLLLLKEFAVVCFNDEFAKVTGWPVTIIDVAMMALVVLVTVAGLQAVGLLLIVALLIIPPTAARFWTNRLSRFVAVSGIFGAMSGYLGAVTSASAAGLPAGAVIVLTSGVIFTISLLLAPKRGMIAGIVQHQSLRIKLSIDHLVEALLELQTNAHSSKLSSISDIAHHLGWTHGKAWRVALCARIASLIKSTGNTHALTEKGHRHALRIARNHRLWEQYLISYADIAPSHVDWSVDQVEHVLSEELVQRLEGALAQRGIIVPSLASIGAGTS
ncbi:MAG: metal ABC transporter permease [Phycisphaeraceae bacterium]|nr:metal ABC transporter permease [Phycisphaerales bacterium]MCB9860570.1 metal ABC transporter permease [Phycisphaeraceae bacterium]